MAKVCWFESKIKSLAPSTLARAQLFWNNQLVSRQRNGCHLQHSFERQKQIGLTCLSSETETKFVVWCCKLSYTYRGHIDSNSFPDSTILLANKTSKFNHGSGISPRNARLSFSTNWRPSWPGLLCQVYELWAMSLWYVMSISSTACLLFVCYFIYFVLKSRKSRYVDCQVRPVGETCLPWSNGNTVRNTGHGCMGLYYYLTTFM